MRVDDDDDDKNNNDERAFGPFSLRGGEQGQNIRA